MIDVFAISFGSAWVVGSASDFICNAVAEIPDKTMLDKAQAKTMKIILRILWLELINMC